MIICFSLGVHGLRYEAQFAALQQEWQEDGLVSSEAAFNKTLLVKSGQGQDLSSRL